MSAVVNLKGHSIIFGVPLSGFGDGSAAEIEFPPEFTMLEGVDGSAAIAYTGAKSAKIKLKLIQTAKANSILSAFRAANLGNLEAGGGGIFMPFMIRDNNGFDQITSPRAMIMGPPKYTLSNTPQSREWEIQAFECKSFLGGNPLGAITPPVTI